MALTKKRWLILGACCLINLCIGSLYAWSVFAVPMAAHLSELTGTHIASLAIIFTVANAVGPVTMISGGFVNDKLGPKWVVLVGGLLFGAGMILSGFTKSVGALMVTYGLGVGLGVGLVYGCTVSNAVKFFPDRSGFAGGLSTASYGISSVIVPLVANALISRMDVTAAFKWLGLAMLIPICACAFIMDPCPPGFKPDGWEPPVRQASAAGGKNWKAMLRDPIFYVMILTLCCGAFSGLMIISQASPIAQNMVGMTATQAATAVSVLALFNTAGRIIAGYTSDKIGTVNTIKLVFVLSMAAQIGLCLGGSSVAVFYGCLCAAGLAFGSIMGVFPGFTAAQFGAKYNGVNYGIMWIGFAAAGYFGPTIMSSLYLSSGSYAVSFLCAAALSALGLALIFLYHRMSRKAP